MIHTEPFSSIISSMYLFETPLGKTKTDQNRLLKICNSLNPSIKFTMETSYKELRLLDILFNKTVAGYG